MKRLLLPALFALACAAEDAPAPREPRLSNVRQVTSGGENAEAYFSADGTHLVLQSTHGDLKADQVFIVPVAGGPLRMVSSGKGKCTCAYFFPDGKRVLYATTAFSGDEPPPKPDFSKGYVWAVHDEYDIVSVNVDGSDLRRLTDAPGYDAEATVSADGRRIVFTSHREGDLDLYSMDADGKNVKRLTDEPGYDGGAFFSPDGSRIVYRAHHPEGESLEEFRALLKEGKVRPSTMELFVMNADGTGRRKVTSLGGANFAPFWHPDGRRIIFASNKDDPKQRNFDLYMVNDDGSGLEKITDNPTFDGFPMFSPDGKRLVFASNRNSRAHGETNIFIADWIEEPPGR